MIISRENTAQKQKRLEYFSLFVLSLYKILFFGIHASHDFADLLFAWGSTHASKHRANHFFIHWWVFFELFLKEITSDKETNDATYDEHADAE